MDMIETYTALIKNKIMIFFSKMDAIKNNYAVF